MQLCDALEVGKGDVVCFVGAGGKTSASMQLARELAAQELRTCVTTTTKILEPIPRSGECLLFVETLEHALDEISQAFSHCRSVIVAHRRLEIHISLAWLGPDYPLKIRSQKLEGLLPEWIDEVARRRLADAIIVEGDGAEHRMLKAPAAHEPVVPECTTLLVPMADLECLGKPLSDELVHRPTLLADLAGLPLGVPICPEAIAVALLHPQSNPRVIPTESRIVPLLTTHAPASDAGNVKKVARLLLLSPRVKRVVLAHLRSEPPVVEVLMP